MPSRSASPACRTSARAATTESSWYDQAKLGVRRGFGSPWLRIGAVRAELVPAGADEALRTRLMAADHAGLQLSVIGPRGGSPSLALDLFEAIAASNGG